MQTTQFDRILRRIATVLSVVILSLCLIYVSTGILLSFYYEPTAGGAYRSLRMIDNEVAYGWLFHRAHDISGNLMIAIALVQIVVMFLGRQFRNSWLVAWVSGIFFTLSAIGLDWTAMLLDWTQEGYWRFNIELGNIQAIPLVGTLLKDIITGGGAISSLTVLHLYTLHNYLITIAAVIFALVHLAALLWQERQMYSLLAEEPIQLTEASLVES